MGAALVVTLALLSTLDRAFTPAPRWYVAPPQPGSRTAPVEVAIVPSRIEVVALRTGDVATAASERDAWIRPQRTSGL